MKRAAVFATVVLAVLVLGAACSSGGGNKSSGGPAQDQTIIIARQTDLSTLDPARAFCDTCQIYFSATYQTLVTVKPESLTDVQGVVAQTWDISPDIKTYTFHLNPAAKFANGDPLTAADVAFTLDRMKNVKNATAFFMDGVSSIDVVDAQTVRVNLAKPDSSFLYKVMSPYAGILNSKVLQANGGSDAPDADTADTAQTFLDANSAGSGPYTLESWTRSVELRLKRNDNYWGPASTAQAQTVVIKEVKDANTQRQLLERGDVDIAMNITQDVADQMQNSQNVSVKFDHSYNFLYLEMNETADPRLTKPVRQAISRAIDYNGVLAATVGGHGQQPSTTVPQGFLGTDLVPPLKTDTDAAKQLLADGGQAGGFSVKLGYPNQVLYGVDMNVLAQKLAADLKTIGIDVQLEPLEVGVWAGQYSTGALPLTLGYWAPDYPDTSEYVAWFGLVGNVGTPSQWLGNVVDQKIVDLSGQALATTDSNERAQRYKEAMLQMQDDAYDIALVGPDLVLANRAGIQNNVYSACCNLVIGQLLKQ